MGRPLNIFGTYLLIMLVFGGLVYFLPKNMSAYILPDASSNNIDSTLFVQNDVVMDSIVIPLSDSLLVDTITTDTLKLASEIFTVQYLTLSDNTQNQLRSFFKNASSARENKETIRVLHMGDSQIEGDRITKFIRQSLQEKYGGSGPGLFTVVDPQKQNPSIWLDQYGEWSLHRIYNRQNILENNQYGLMGTIARFQPKTNSGFMFRPSPWAESRAKNYYKVRLFFGAIKDTLLLNGYINKTRIIEDTLAISDGITEINWEFEDHVPKLKLMFQSSSSPPVLGCALDSLAGVAVDNLALRGQSTPRLHQTNHDLFKAMVEHLDIGLILFQFGTNMIPTITNDFGFYQIQLQKQLKILKELAPDCPIIVIGTGDAAFLEEGSEKAYSHIQTLSDAQKEAALAMETGFFDLYEAMGGKGSMINWVNQEPPLAMSDYIHFTKKGGEKVSELILSNLYSIIDTDEEVNPDSLHTHLDSLRWTTSSTY